MRILIDIGHPGHVHLFKNFAKEMQKRGHEFLFTCRQKEFEIELLKAEGFDYVSFGKKYNTTLGKIWGLFKFDVLEFLQGLRFKPDIFMSHGSPYAAHASAILRKPHISMEDSGNWEQIKIYLPFTEVVLTPSVLYEDMGPKQIRYNGYHELAYLHPNHFQINSTTPHSFLNLQKDEKYVLLRFVSWNASHDKGQNGLSADEKEKLVNYLDSKYTVFISSENKLPEKFQKFQIKIAPENMHLVLSGAHLFVGEGATMASESGVLGTPSIYVNSLKRAYNEDQEKYGLVFNFQDGNGVLDKIKELEKIPNLHQNFQKRLQKLLTDKIDVTSFMVWFVENFPESQIELKNNPNYQLNFK
ncbi:DUF354 domain-containing protein [Aquimarina muelleri]|uniref:DUF354 domain-containing protein n=1 Tax=Aquimarina muelleri TaxID=279356 RepID=A0A918JRR6_9FLAO|nr:DUF354 domain-containing protein [Aquimarina muelleri]MCX2762064.1 DUF354 domain-containing protein [Aquimarina muelleri]GGX04172.1 hypothetical protein GCM10007384_02460 [Aquimarina muelleri]